jgi:hypothetical protein
MTDRAQFEAMLEALINENHDAAKEIFHNIVVGKSREIYEELLESDFSQDQGNPYGKKDDEEEVSEEGEEEMPVAEEGDEEEADDAEDDSEDDAEDNEMDADDEFGGDEEGGDMEDRVMDLEDALEDLKAEFEQLLAGEEAEEADHPGIHDMGGDDMGGMGEPEGEMDELEQMMEYVNKVSPPKHGDNGANAKSIVAGKNDMGGTSANIAKSFSTTSGGTQGGLLKPSTTLQDGGNINKPGASAGKSAFKKKEPGHGAESKGKSETADNKQSTLRPLKK